MPVSDTQVRHLHDMAVCHMACFPKSLSSRLGIGYVTKTLEWFLVSPNRFLYHINVDDNVAGYCGGFVPQKFGDGSSSGMLQYAFNQAIAGLVLHPWLLLHPEVRQQYKFLWLNVKRKFTGKLIPLGGPTADPGKPSHVGLVVIGVHPQYRGSGVARLLADEFDKRALTFDRHELVLSVKSNNHRAINAYKKFGWKILKEQQKTFVMHKMI